MCVDSALYFRADPLPFPAHIIAICSCCILSASPPNTDSHGHQSKIKLKHSGGAVGSGWLGDGLNSVWGLIVFSFVSSAYILDEIMWDEG